MFKYIFLGSFFFITTLQSISQKRINVHLKFPQNAEIKTLVVAVDDGRSEINIPLKGKMEVLNNLFISEFVSLKVSYSLKNGVFGNDLFFVNENRALIEYFFVASDSNRLNYKLSHVFDFITEKNNLKNYTLTEYLDCKEFLEKYSDSLSNNNPLLDSLYKVKFSILAEKELQYVSMNYRSYYSKWYFRRNLLKSVFLDKKNTIDVFNKFSQQFIRSQEGVFIKKFIQSYESFIKGKELPNFSTKDIEGKKITLDDYKNKSNVLIGFWATWCIPCIKEMPKIKEIKKEFKQLEIIFVSYDSDMKLCLSKIKEFQMNWKNVINDIDLINAYGGYKAIPRLYLLNKKGHLIYDRIVDSDADYSKLNSLLRELYQ